VASEGKRPRKSCVVKDLLPPAFHRLGDLYFGKDLATVFSASFPNLHPNRILATIAFASDLKGTTDNIKPSTIWRHLSTNHKKKSGELGLAGSGKNY